MSRAGVAVYFDLETGGVQDTHPDIQLAAIAIDEASWAELATFEAKIHFDEAMADVEALKLNHYSAEVWAATALPETLVVARFASFLDRFRTIQMVSKRTGNSYAVAKLVGHNAASFDGPRLQRMFGRYGRFLPADPRVRCTCQRALWWFDERGIAPRDYKLATIAERFGISVDGAHDALADVRLTILISQAMDPCWPRNGVVEQITSLGTDAAGRSRLTDQSSPSGRPSGNEGEPE